MTMTSNNGLGNNLTKLVHEYRHFEWKELQKEDDHLSDLMSDYSLESDLKWIDQ